MLLTNPQTEEGSITQEVKAAPHQRRMDSRAQSSTAQKVRRREGCTTQKREEGRHHHTNEGGRKATAPTRDRSESTTTQKEKGKTQLTRVKAAPRNERGIKPQRKSAPKRERNATATPTALPLSGTAFPLHVGWCCFIPLPCGCCCFIFLPFWFVAAFSVYTNLFGVTTITSPPLLPTRIPQMSHIPSTQTPIQTPTQTPTEPNRPTRTPTHPHPNISSHSSSQSSVHKVHAELTFHDTHVASLISFFLPFSFLF